MTLVNRLVAGVMVVTALYWGFVVGDFARGTFDLAVAILNYLAAEL